MHTVLMMVTCEMIYDAMCNSSKFIKIYLSVFHIYPVPQFNVTDANVKDFINELKGFHEVFSDCFDRSEYKDNFFGS